MSLSQGGFLFLLLDVTMPPLLIQSCSFSLEDTRNIYFFQTQIDLENRHKLLQIILFNLIISTTVPLTG